MKVIVYQGYEEKFKLRVRDDDGSNLLYPPDSYDSQQDAVKAAEKLANKLNAEVEVRETISELAEREATEAQQD